MEICKIKFSEIFLERSTFKNYKKLIFATLFIKILNMPQSQRFPQDSLEL